MPTRSPSISNERLFYLLIDGQIFLETEQLFQLSGYQTLTPLLEYSLKKELILEI